MSFKGSVHYWHFGPLDFHVFTHALDPKARRFYEVNGRQVWPPRAILDHRNEWTVQSRDELIHLIQWAIGRLKEVV